MKITNLPNNCELREYSDGSKYYFQNGKLHRLDGPAVEYSDGAKQWYQNNQLHRLDGPAVIYSNGTKEWYFYGKFFCMRFFVI